MSMVVLRTGAHAEASEVRRIASEVRLLGIQKEGRQLLAKFFRHCSGEIERFTADQLRTLGNYELVAITPQGFQVSALVRNVVLSLVFVREGRYYLHDDAIADQARSASSTRP